MKKIILILLTFSSVLLNSISANLDVQEQTKFQQLQPYLIATKEQILNAVAKTDKVFKQLQPCLTATKEQILNVAININNTFNYVAARIDTILTKQGAIKTLLILGPLFATYCYFFPPDPVKALIKKIVGSATQGASEIAVSAIDGINNNEADVMLALNKVTHQLGKLQGTYNINYEIGQTSGLWQGMWNSPFSTIGLLISKGLEKTTAVGIPFALGLFAQRLILTK